MGLGDWLAGQWNGLSYRWKNVATWATATTIALGTPALYDQITDEATGAAVLGHTDAALEMVSDLHETHRSEERFEERLRERLREADTLRSERDALTDEGAADGYFDEAKVAERREDTQDDFEDTIEAVGEAYVNGVYQEALQLEELLEAPVLSPDQRAQIVARIRELREHSRRIQDRLAQAETLAEAEAALADARAPVPPAQIDGLDALQEIAHSPDDSEGQQQVAESIGGMVQLFGRSGLTSGSGGAGRAPTAAETEAARAALAQATAQRSEAELELLRRQTEVLNDVTAQIEAQNEAMRRR